ncbi:carbamoyl-phosphate synthase (glutamine-hydrolyzing) cpa2, partial [Dinochytrium kinnereticum]
MNVAHTETSLRTFLTLASDVSPDHPVVVTKFIRGAQEIDVDAVADQGRLLTYAVSQHVEDAGVHSGDATLVIPPVYEGEKGCGMGGVGVRGVTKEIVVACREIAEKVASAFKITGTFNMQLILSRSPEGVTPQTFNLKVIECNLRASRSLPYVSKALDVDFVDIATQAILQLKPPATYTDSHDPMLVDRPYKVVKAPVFSWTRLAGADPVLGVEMASTGEVACFGRDLTEAYLTALLSNHTNIKALPPPRGSSFVIAGDAKTDRGVLEHVAERLVSAGYEVFTDSEETAVIVSNAIGRVVEPIVRGGRGPLVRKLLDRREALGLFEERRVAIVFALHGERARDVEDAGYVLRRTAVDLGVGMVNEPRGAALLADAIWEYGVGGRTKDEAVLSWSEW